MRRRISLSILLTILSISSTRAQFVTIPDVKFAALLNAQFPSCMNGNQMDTTCTAIVTAQGLLCYSEAIFNLTGISYFDSLQVLWCQNNFLTTMPRLPSKLTELLCDNNDLSSLPLLPSTLVTLSIQGNNFTTVPALPASVTKLWCSNNSFSSLGSLPPGLITLLSDNCSLTSLPSIPGTLQYLQCNENQLSSIPALPSSLKQLRADNNLLTALPPLPAAIETLLVYHNQLTSLPTLPASLKFLGCGYNSISSLPTIPATLRNFYGQYNLLVSIPNLPDTVDNINITDNPDFLCLPPVKRINNLMWTNTKLHCLPDGVSIGTGAPAVNGLPMCSTTPFLMEGSTGICRPSAGNIYSVNYQPGVNYNWTIPTGATITSGQGTNSISVSFASNASAGNICVSGPGCNLSLTSCKPVVARSSLPSTPGVITGNNNACGYGPYLYSIKKVNNADFYLWTAPASGYVNGTNAPVITKDTFVYVTFSSLFTGDTLRVRSVNCKGNSAERKLRINHNAPGTPGTISGLNIGLCNQTNVTYLMNAVTNATDYTWRSNIAAVLFNGNAGPYTTTNPTVNITFGTFTTGQVYVKANNGCGSSAERSLTVNAKPAVPTIINGPVSVCDGQLGVAYSTVAVSNASSYNWTVPSGSSVASGQGTVNATVNFGATPLTGNVRVRATNSCANSAYLTKSVTINNCPRSGIDDSKELSIHPNPFSGTAIIELPTDIDLKKCRLQILDITGHIVKVFSGISDYTIILNDERFNKGIYFLQLVTSDRTTSIKVVID